MKLNFAAPQPCSYAHSRAARPSRTAPPTRVDSWMAVQNRIGNQAAMRHLKPCSRKDLRAGGTTSDVPKAATFEWMDPDSIDYSQQIGDVVGTFEAPNAGSACNIDTGEYEIKFNDNQTCTRDCTQMHEERHQLDLGPCCRAAAGRVAAGADRRLVQNQWNNWVLSGAGPWSECNAHAISVACGQTVLSINNCGAESSKCCADADYYVFRQKGAKTVACSTAPPNLPGCPF